MTEMPEFSRQRANLLEAECVKVSELSEGLLRATLTRGQGFNKVDERLRSATAGSNIRGARFDALFEGLVLESDPLESWQRVLDELDRLAGTDEPDALTSEVTPTLARLGLPIADIRRAAAKLTPEGWLGLALTPITDQPHFEYQTKNGTFIEFTIASAGQQATALLRVLLAQPPTFSSVVHVPLSSHTAARPRGTLLVRKPTS